MATYKIVFTTEAVKELQEGVRYYNSKQRGLGKRFFQDMKGQIELIKSNPFLKSIRYDNVRFALGDIFPYAIHYTFSEANETITIHAILSHWQKPRS
jgi:mRNA-degrading endonuclease RelE of RelBE toxin-antitoxin system